MSETVLDKIQKLTPAKVHAWLIERLENACRISGLKAGADRDGWLEDAAYLSVAVNLAAQAITLQAEIDGWKRTALAMRDEAIGWAQDGNSRSDAIQRLYFDAAL